MYVCTAQLPFPETPANSVSASFKQSWLSITNWMLVVGRSMHSIKLTACGSSTAFATAACFPPPYPIVLYEWTRESECKHLIAVVCLFEVHTNKIGPTHTRHTPLWSHFSQHWLHICWSPFQLPLPPHHPQSWVSWLHQGNPTYNKVKPSSVSANRPSGASSFSSHSWPN